MNARAGRSVVLLAILLPFAPSSVHSQVPLTEHTLGLDPDAPRPRAAVEDLAWLSGEWWGEALGGVAEEVWSGPAGGQMMGMFRLVRGGDVSFYEIFTLSDDGGSLAIRLKHFGPDLVGWEERDEVVVFPLLRTGEGVAWFEGLTFRRSGPDGLVVHLAMTGRDGAVREETFTYRRRGR